MKKKIAVIGCGNIFEKHYEAIKIQESKKKLDLVAVCDVDENLLKKIKIKNLRKYTSITELLKNEKLDIVSILTPSGFHYNAAIKCMKKVRSIIVEKPITLKMSHAQKLLKECKKNKNNFYVVLQNRFHNTIQELKKAIDKKLFGKIFLSTIRLRWSRGEDYYSQADWRGTWQLDGGVVANQSSHFIDLFQWLFGMPHKVFSRIRQMQNIKKEVEDTALAIFEYKYKNKLGLIEATNAVRPKNLEGSLSVIGEKGSVIVGGTAGEKLIEWTLKKNSKIKQMLNNKNIHKNAHIAFYEYVIDNIIYNRKKNTLDIEEAMKSLKIINSIYFSSNLSKSSEVEKVHDTFLGNKNKIFFKLK